MAVASYCYYEKVPRTMRTADSSFNCSSEEDPVSCIMKKYQNHSSLKLIKTKNKFKIFRFRETNTDKIKKVIETLDPKKASQKSVLSTNIF